MIVLRPLVPFDSDAAYSLDVQGSYYPWARQQWRIAGKTHVHCGAFHANANILVGVLAAENRDYDIRIIKLAVRKDFQRQGIAGRMISELCAASMQNNYKRVSVVLPERDLPGPLSQLFHKNGFFSVPPIQRDYFFRDGRCEDGFIFIRQLKSRVF